MYGRWCAQAYLADFGRQLKLAVIRQDGANSHTFVKWDAVGTDGWAVYRTVTDAESRRDSEDLNSSAWLTLDMDAARALYEALGKHFEGMSSVSATRKDYDAERARVDKMIDALIKCQP